MKEFLLVFRRDVGVDRRLSPEQLQQMTKPWQEWMAALRAGQQLVSPGNRLDTAGRVMRVNGVSHDPYMQTREIISGYVIVKAPTLEDAAALSNNCPILLMGGNVEVRPIVAIH